MKRDRVRDQAIDHLLRRQQPDGDAATPADVCLEPDVMAAWMEGSLRKAEVEAAQAHAARCARCQSVLAALARAEPALVPAAHPPRRLSLTLRWLIPLATASAAVAVWIAVSPSDRPAAPAPPVASRTVAQEGRATVPPESAEPSVAPVDRLQARSVAARKTVPDRRDEKTERAPESPPTSTPALAPNDRVAGVGQTMDAVMGGREKSAAAPAAGRGGREGGGTLAPPARPAASALADSVSARQFIAGAAPIDVVSPDPAFRWRVRADGTVERTVDGGITWDLQPSAQPGLVRAGSSPSPQVCWLVGGSGLVQRSTDGRTWQRVAFPEAVDLAGIRATDGSHAIVTTLDGRRFTTADGGATWSEMR